MVAIGVDTHKQTHTCVAVDKVGRVLGEIDIETDKRGFNKLLEWSLQYGQKPLFGIEGSGSFGAGLCEFLMERKCKVYEVEQPKRKARRRGKSDSIDALYAAKAVLAGEGVSIPRSKGKREALRVMLLTHDSCVDERTRLTNQLQSLLVTAPCALNRRIGVDDTNSLVKRVKVMRHSQGAGDVERACLAAMKSLVKRISVLDGQIKSNIGEITTLVRTLKPEILKESGVGPIAAAKLLVVDAARFSSESKFARANGTAPIPASSGNTQRHRLNRGGDRQANRAIHMIALSRCLHHSESKRYIVKKVSEGKTKKEAMRSLKRRISRRLYKRYLCAV